MSYCVHRVLRDAQASVLPTGDAIPPRMPGLLVFSQSVSSVFFTTPVHPASLRERDSTEIFIIVN